MTAIPRLTDGVVTLRAPSDDDIDGSVEQCRDPQTVRWTTVPHPYTRDDAKTYLRHVIPGGWAAEREWGFVVEALDDDGAARFAGSVSLRNENDGRAEIAYGAHPWARGRGVMERALRLLLEWGFAERDLRTVIWVASRGNWASRRLAWRLGFTLDGTLRSWLAQRGDLADAWVGTLRRDEQMAPGHAWLVPPRITGPSVVLRAPVEADVPRTVEALNDPTVQRYGPRIRAAAPHDEATVRERTLGTLEEQAGGTTLSWTVADTDSDELLGWIALFHLEPGRDAEVGYWAHSSARGRGAVSAACRAVVRHAFIDAEEGGLGLQRLHAKVALDNVASQRVVERAGFQRVGLERQSMVLPDVGPVDAVLYDQLTGDHERHDW